MAIQQSGSLIFPFKIDEENDCLMRATTVETVVLSSIKCFLITRKGSRVGNNIGSFLPELLLTGISVSALPALAEELRTELSNEFAGVNFITVALTQEITQAAITLKVSISLSIPASGNVLDFQINLPSIFKA